MYYLRLLSFLLLLLTGCYQPQYYEELPDPPALVSINIIDRNGVSETITQSDRLEMFEKVDFLCNQPYQKVMRVYARDACGDIRSYITSYHPSGQIKQYLEVLNGRANGNYIEWHANGAKKIEGVVIGGSADIVPGAESSWLFDGCCRVWNEQSQLTAVFNYARGELEGDVVYYHPNGRVWKEATYRKQQMEGIYKVWDIDVLLNLSLRHVRFQHLGLADADNVSCHYISSSGLSLRHIDTVLLNEDNTTLSQLRMGRLFFSSQGKEMELENLAFAIPPEQVLHTLQTLNTACEGKIPAACTEFAASLKPQDVLSGTLNYEWSGEHSAFKLSLDSGSYTLFGTPHSLAQIHVEYDPFELKASTVYTYHHQPYSLVLQAQSPRLTEGEITISPFETTPSARPLIIHWDMDANYQPAIKAINGHLSGMLFQLARQDPLAPYITGDIYLDGRTLLPLLPPEYRQTFSDWKIGAGYKLSGTLTLEQSTFTPLFKGQLVGQEFDFKGYRFNTLTSAITITPEAILAEKTVISDPAVVCELESIHLFKNSAGAWILSIPDTNIKDLRPALLRDGEETAGHKQKALVIQNMRIKGIQGFFGEADSFSGFGTLVFINPPKKNLPNILFAIPGEILTRLGLDLSLLTPVAGQVDFALEQGKIFLKEFRDVVSDGKISKFHLANQQSHIDFDGNINVQVRLKQSNVLLKLAELFTINIQGTLKKPLYNIQRPVEK